MLGSCGIPVTIVKWILIECFSGKTGFLWNYQWPCTERNVGRYNLFPKTAHLTLGKGKTEVEKSRLWLQLFAHSHAPHCTSLKAPHYIPVNGHRKLFSLKTPQFPLMRERLHFTVYATKNSSVYWRSNYGLCVLLVTWFWVMNLTSSFCTNLCLNVLKLKTFFWHTLCLKKGFTN